MGTINLHASLLPKYRGAAPINWAIIHGEKETGITTFKLQHAIDTGDVLMRQTIPIRPDETAGELHDEMKALGAQLVYDTLVGYCKGELKPVPQLEISQKDLEELPAAPKIHTSTCHIDWQKKASSIFNLIRGLSPYPGAFTYLDEKMLKIYKASYANESTSAATGAYESDGKTFLRFAATDGWVYVKELQLEGKKRMHIEDFLRGFRFS
jgi:methionyl-tRNA formyltransferase